MGEMCPDKEIPTIGASQGACGGGGPGSGGTFDGDVTILNDCSNPIPIVGCPGQPLEVVLTNPQPQIDVQVVCDDATDTWHYITFIDGVPQPGTTDTGIACSEPPPVPPADTEPVEECREDTIWNVWYQIQDGALVEVAAADTGLPCSPPPAKFERCVKWQFTVVNLDNSKTQFGVPAELRTTQECGPVTISQLPAFTGWTPQVDGITAAMAALFPDARVESRFNAPGGGGNLPGPPADAPTAEMKFRYTSMLHCATETCMPVRVEWRDMSDPANPGPWVDLVIEVIPTPEKRGRICGEVCGDEAGTLQVLEGGIWVDVPEADLPPEVCIVGCDEIIPAPPVPVCTTTSKDGCDSGFDPALPVTRFDTSCPGEPLDRSYWIEDPGSGGLVPHTLVGQFVDCATGEPFPEDPCLFQRQCIQLIAKDPETGFWCSKGLFNVETPTCVHPLVDGSNITGWFVGFEPFAALAASGAASPLVHLGLDDPSMFKVVPCDHAVVLGDPQAMLETSVTIPYPVNQLDGVTNNILDGSVTLTDVCSLTVTGLGDYTCPPEEQTPTVVSYVIAATGQAQEQAVWPGQTIPFDCFDSVTITGNAIIHATTSITTSTPQGDCS